MMTNQDIQTKGQVKSVSGMTNFNEVVQGAVYTKLDDLNFILANNSPGLVLLPLPAPTITGLSILYQGMGDAQFTVTWNYEGNPTAYIFYIENDTRTFTETITPTSHALAFTNKSRIFGNSSATPYVGNGTILKVKMAAQISGRLTSQSTVLSAHSISIEQPQQTSTTISIKIILNEEYTDLNTTFTYTLNNINLLPSDIAVIEDTPTYRRVAFASRLPNTVYTIQVKALKGIVETISNGLYVTTLLSPPTSITNSAPTSITSSGFTVNWTGGTGATSYTYTINGSAATPSSSTSQSATFTGLAANTGYSVIVTAVNNGGSTPSSSLSITTLIAAPTQPTDISGSNITSSGFTVNWAGGTGATSYTYTLNGSAATPSSSTATSATFTSLAANTAYSVIVTAVNAAGSTSSSSLSVSTFPNSLVSLRASSYSGSGTWNDESGNGKNATIASGTIAKNEAGNGIVLNGSTHWTFPNIAAGNSWTVSVWVNLASNPSGNWAAVVTQILVPQGSTLSKGNLTICRSQTLTNGMVIMFIINGSSFNVGTSFTYTLNTWIHMVGTWDGTNMKTYINGTLRGSTTPGGTAVDSGGAYIIGRDWGGNNSYIQGEIGEVTIFNTPLSATQVSQIYANSRGTYGV